MRIVFWGIGNTAKNNMDRIKKLSNQFEILAFIDGYQKYNADDILSTWEGYRLITPQMLHELNVDYVCILSVWEWEIRKRIYGEQLFDLTKIISFHELCMMDSFGMDVKCCYKKLLEIVHPLQRASVEKWMAYEYLKRNYAYVLCDSKYWKIDVNRKADIKNDVKPIWILWLQGVEHAPELVKICIRSVQRALGKEEYICLLDKNNLFDYINLPECIIQKWEKGIIDNTKFSDLVRLRLLNVYGGLWLDATTYFTGNKLPRYIKENKFFMYNIWVNWRSGVDPRVSPSWLISSEPANKLLMILEALHIEYWKKEDSVINYYFFHLFWRLVVECFPDEWEQIENILRDPATLLEHELPSRFDTTRFCYLKKISDIHKLSYKMPFEEMGKDSFWTELCNIDRNYVKNQNS